MATRITVKLEDMDQASADALGLWLDMVLRDETQHQIREVTVERDVN